MRAIGSRCRWLLTSRAPRSRGSSSGSRRERAPATLDHPQACLAPSRVVPTLIRAWHPFRVTDALVLVEREPPIATVTLNRPKQLNALSDELMQQLVAELTTLDTDTEIRCIVLGGSERAFAAGADIGCFHRRRRTRRRPRNGL